MPPADSTASSTGRKLDPDITTRKRLIAAGSKLLYDKGVAAVTVADVLAGANLSTRAFYRHFESKDQLIQAIFRHLALAETRRLRRRMESAVGPLEAVACWVQGRLDLAFDSGVRSNLQAFSRAAQSQAISAPELIGPAFRDMLHPLIEQLEIGIELGIFHDVDPLTDAELMHGAIWACIERHWSDGHANAATIRDQCVRFCLCGLGVSGELVAGIIEASRR